MGLYHNNFKEFHRWGQATGIPLSEIEYFIDDYMTQYIGKTSPGAAVVLVKGGKIIFSKGYGYADLEKGTMVDACVDALAEMGYDLEVVVFDDNVMPNTAIMEGTIDANMYQHVPFMETFNKTKGGKLVMLEPKLFYTTIGFYSEKYDSVKALPEKASIVVGSDPSNIDRALRMLDAEGLITLVDKKKDFYNIHDVVENPKNYLLKEVAGQQVVNNMQDVDAAVLYGTTVLEAGKDPSTALFFDDKTRDKTYAIGVVVHENNKDSQWVQDLVDAFMSETTWANVDAHFKGSYAKAYDD
jgi:D-methionine transport system substrate-binding protein